MTMFVVLMNILFWVLLGIAIASIIEAGADISHMRWQLDNIHTLLKKLTEEK